MNTENEWENEKNIEVFNYRGYECLIFRNNLLKHLCGYVKIYNKSYPPNLDVHGEITFSDTFKDFDDERKIFNGFYIGFDCAHAGDIIPKFIEDNFNTFPEDTYKNFEFVRNQLKYLVEQLEKRMT